MEFNEKLWHGSYMDSLRTMQHDYLAMMNNTLEILLKLICMYIENTLYLVLYFYAMCSGLFYLIFVLYWSIVDLQCCGSFSHIAK